MAEPTRRVALYSLGCAKNQVDAEQMLGLLSASGYEVITEPEQAEVVVVNTCGFLAAAREEALRTIAHAARLKRHGACQQLVVSGCFAQIQPQVVADRCPEVDLIVGVSQFGHLAELLAEADGRQRTAVTAPEMDYPEWLPRRRSTPPWTAYVKIGEGCDCNCAFCLIPTIRGRLRSRTVPDIVAEARGLAADGVREVVLIGEDTTGFGADRGRAETAELLRALNEVEGLDWIRLMYAYPTKVSDDLIAAMAESERVLAYLDMPLQHAADSVLRAMRRGGRRARYLELIERLRSAMPEICIRSTFIVGYPGERRGEFEELAGFLAEVRLDRVGFFPFSPEPGTDAADLPGAAGPGVVQQRIAQLAQLQAGISRAKGQALVGRRLTVLCERVTGDEARGRSYRDAPEIDGLVRFGPAVGTTLAQPGEFAEVLVEGADEHDVWGRQVGGEL